MPKSDPAPPPAIPTRLRDLGGAKASDRRAFAIAVVLALVFAIGTLWIARNIMEERIADVAIMAEEAAGTLANSVADDFAAAIAIGIPLDKVRGTAPYLESALQSDSLVSEIAVFDLEENALYRAPAHARLTGRVRVPIVSEGKTYGTVMVTPSSQIVDRVRRHVRDIAIASALVLAIAVAVFLRLVALERINLPQARLAASTAAAARGVYADFTPPDAGPMRRIGQRGAHLTGPLRRNHRQLMELTDEVRALDTSGRLKARIETALAPLRDLVFDRPMAATSLSRGRLWWPGAALMGLLATRPLVASFAADRVGPNELATLFIAITLTAFALGGLLGLALARAPVLRGSKFVSAFGTVVAGIAIGITAVLRDPYHFIVAQFVAGLFGVWGVAAAFEVNGALRRLPWRGGLVLLGAIAIAMPSGALLAETEGRRLAFATVGVLTVLVGFAALAGPARRVRKRAPATSVPAEFLFAAAAVALAMSSFADVALSAAVFREDYAGLALAGALIGAGSLLPVALLPRRIGQLAPFGALLATMALFATFEGVPPYAGAVAIGLGLGGVCAGLGAKTLTGPSAAAFIGGLLLAALATLAAGVLALPGLPVAGAASALLTALAFAALLRQRA